MPTIPYICSALDTVLNVVANTAARSTGFIQRQRQLTGASFVQALVFGFLAKPTMSLDQLAQTAAVVGTTISAQGLDQRFTRQAADCLRAVLGAAVQQLVSTDPVAIPLLQRFTGVYLSIVRPSCCLMRCRACGAVTGAAPPSGRPQR